MDLDAQISDLIQGASGSAVTADAVQAIAPTLKAIAGQLQHDHYYILQTLEQGWVMTTLSSRNQPDVKKNIVYAYQSLKDAGEGPVSVKDPQVMALPVPVTHILFQMLAMKPVHSVVFMEQPGQAGKGVEVRRQDIEALIQAQLKQSQPGGPMPPELA
jgi:hypothetical protein